MPTVSTKPAMPGSVSVEPMTVITATIRVRLIITAMTAKRPKRP